MGSQLVARFPGGMLSLAFLIHIERIHHSYGAQGGASGGGAFEVESITRAARGTRAPSRSRRSFPSCST